MCWLPAILLILQLPAFGLTKTLVMNLDLNADDVSLSETNANGSLMGFEEMENDALDALTFSEDSKLPLMASELSQDKSKIKYEFDKIPPDSKCEYEKCLKICEVIYKDVPDYYAQCMDMNCFCFKKEPLFPNSMKHFLRSATLFGMPQQYD